MIFPKDNAKIEGLFFSISKVVRFTKLLYGSNCGVCSMNRFAVCICI